jgi:hypothetical protein
MTDPNELLTRVRMLAANTHASNPVSGLHHDLARAVQDLDAHLRAGGNPPVEWVEGPDEPTRDGLPVEWRDGPERHDPRPEGFGIVAHWSTVHDGVNLEMDVPDGLRVTVYYNGWLAVDSVAGVDPVVGAL